MAFTRNRTEDDDDADAEDETKNKWLPPVLFLMVDYAVCTCQNQPPTTNSLPNIMILCICTMTLTFDLGGQGNILFPLIDFMGERVKTKASIFLG